MAASDLNGKQSRCRGEGVQARAHKPRTRSSGEAREPLKYNQADGGSRSFRECRLVLAR